MNKSSFFTGQPIFCQLLSLLSRRDIARTVEQCNADRYCKRFTTWNHLVTMLFGVFYNCTSLREIAVGMLACEGRLQSLGIKHFSKRSTLSDANQRRDQQVFEKLYYLIYERLSPFLSDSRLKSKIKNLFIIDSTTISLFQEIFTAAGRNPSSGKRKGGVKVHMAVQAEQAVPYLVCITPSSKNDTTFLKQLSFPSGSYVVFDKGYNSFDVFNRLTKGNVNWVTRIRAKNVITVVENNPVSEKEKVNGVLQDQRIVLGHSTKAEKVTCRLITYWDAVNKRIFQFITNNHKVLATTIAHIYKRRWEIELLFKRLKQNLLQQYFLGDNQNAIKIQIWVSLIADLLLRAATYGIKRKWSYSNLASLIRMHLMHYTHLKSFLENPEKASIHLPVLYNNNQLKLHLSG